MKITFFDFFLNILSSIVLISLSIASTAIFIAPMSQYFLHDYHVIADFFCFLFFFGLFSGLLVRTILKINPLEQGEFSMDHKNFTCWKWVSMIILSGRAFLLPLTPLAFMPLALNLFGARIGKNVAIAGNIDSPYLTTIGDGTIIGAGSQIEGNMTINGKIFLGAVIIGKNVVIATNSVVLPNVEIGDNAVVEIGSVVMPGSRIPPGERWRGNPARKWMQN